jgi:hypothetical protein
MSPQRRGRQRRINRAKIEVRRKYPGACCEKYGSPRDKLRWRISSPLFFLCERQASPLEAWQAAADTLRVKHFAEALTS